MSNSSDAGDKIGLSKLGEDLGYARRLKSEKRWPPYVPLKENRDLHGDQPPPSTPFLFVPMNAADRGLRPAIGTDWIASQGIMLLSEKAELEVEPRCGNSYRVLALIGNAGNAPSLNAFVEFSLGWESLQYEATYAGYAQKPIEQPFSLGVAALSVESSPANQTIGWAMSPYPWRVTNTGDSITGVAVRVFDPVNDSAPEELRSWDDRHIGSRAFSDNLTGTWSGIEVLESGENIGQFTVTISQNWNLTEIPNGASFFSCSVTLNELPPVSGRTLPLNVAKTERKLRDINVMYDDHIGQPWLFSYFFLGSTDVLEMRCFHGADPGGSSHHFSHAKLTLKKPGAPSPEPSRELLSRVRRVRSPTWPSRRIADADLLFRAISALGI
jgi:hypothetical protein